MKFRLLFSLSVLFAFACEDQGCAGLTPLEVSFPEEEMLTDAVVAHRKAHLKVNMLVPLLVDQLVDL